MESTVFLKNEIKYQKQTKHNCLTILRSNLLTIITVLGVISGVVLGFILRSYKDEPWSQRQISYVNFPGELFLRMLKGLILPLIISSLVSAIGSLDLSLSGKIGGRAIVYYMTTTVSAVILGIILVCTIQPGNHSSISTKKSTKTRNVATSDTLLDLVRNMFPPNLIQASIQQYRTVLTPVLNETDINKWSISSSYENGTNILGLVVFSTFLGITLAKLGPKGKAVLEFFKSLSEAMMMITNLVIWLSPIGVMFLISAKLLEIEDLGEIVGQLGMYFMTVLAGLLIHGFVVLPLIFFVTTRMNPFRFILNMGQALATAFGTASSSVTLPAAISCLEEKNNIDPRVARFTMPIGATINMDGGALYEAVAPIFIAQVRNISLTFGNLVAVCVTATFASVGAAGIPQSGLVTMVMVLDAVGLPAGDVSVIIAVDWLLDRFRTTVNVIGDSLGAGIVHKLSKDELELMSESEKFVPENSALLQ